MSTYNVTFKSGDYVYTVCSGSIYKVNVRKGTKKIIDSGDNIGNMKLYKGYLYYTKAETVFGDDDDAHQGIYRAKTTTCKVKKLFRSNNWVDYHDSWKLTYAISKGRIYYNEITPSKRIKRSMKLNGTNKKKSKVTVYNSRKKSNVKGYSVKQEDHLDFETESGYVIWYLKTPKKKITLRKQTWDDLYGDD